MELLFVPGTFQRGGGVDTSGFSPRRKFWRKENGRRVLKDTTFPVYAIHFNSGWQSHIFQMVSERVSHRNGRISICVYSVYIDAPIYQFSPNVY